MAESVIGRGSREEIPSKYHWLLVVPQGIVRVQVGINGCQGD